MKLLKALTTIIVASSTMTAVAQPADSLTVNLDKAIEIALSNNPTIQIAGKEIERQKYVRKESQGALMPQLSASGSYNYNIMNPVMFMPENVFGPGTGGAMRMGFSNSFAGGVSLSLPLYMPTIYRTLQLNDKQMKLAIEQARASKITLINQVRKNFYAILLAENSLQVIQDNIDYAQVVVRDAENAYKQGVVSQYDMITARVQLSNLMPNLIQVKNSVKTTRLMLNMLLALPLNTNLKIDENLNDFKVFIDSNPEHIIDLSENTELAQIAVQQEILEKQLQLQKALRIPTLSAMAQYQVQTQNNTLNLGSYDWRGTALAGLQLSVPIFAGLSKLQKERQIKNSIEQLTLQKGYLEENVNVSAQTALSNIFTAGQQMTSNAAAREQAKKGYSIARTRFETGAGTIVELNSAQAALLQADLNYSQSIFDYMSFQADFDQIIGNIEQLPQLTK